MIYTLNDLYAIAVIVMCGLEGTHWERYKTNRQWWQLNLKTRLN